MAQPASAPPDNLQWLYSEELKINVSFPPSSASALYIDTEKVILCRLNMRYEMNIILNIWSYIRACNLFIHVLFVSARHSFMSWEIL